VIAAAQALRYVVDPADPRAPDDATWCLLTEEEQRHVAASLPAEVPWELLPPEGDEHREARSKAIDALGRHFRATGRRIYISSDMSIYYPDEPRFAPDVLAVLDVELHARRSWMVQAEKRGLDFVLEVHVAGKLAKDLTDNTERLARLGVGEYFVFDKSAMRVHGYRLPPAERGTVRAGRTYDRIVPQMGRWSSEVLGIDLTIEDGNLRFMAGGGPLEESEEVIARLGALVDAVLSREEEAARRRLEEQARTEELEAKLAEETQAREAAERAREEEKRAREAAERRIAELEAELARRGGPAGSST
jgi:Putative restriction endonuclease